MVVLSQDVARVELIWGGCDEELSMGSVAFSVINLGRGGPGIGYCIALALTTKLSGVLITVT